MIPNWALHRLLKSVMGEWVKTTPYDMPDVATAARIVAGEEWAGAAQQAREGVLPSGHREDPLLADWTMALMAEVSASPPDHAAMQDRLARARGAVADWRAVAGPVKAVDA